MALHFRCLFFDYLFVGWVCFFNWFTHPLPRHILLLFLTDLAAFLFFVPRRRSGWMVGDGRRMRPPDTWRRVFLRCKI